MKNVFGKKKKKKRYKHSYRYRDYLGWPEVLTQWLGLFSFIIDIRVFKTYPNLWIKHFRNTKQVVF
jgi:hypothetical protein